MNILYLGQFGVKSILDKYPTFGLDNYKMSDFLVKGFQLNKEVKLDVITAPDVASYPDFPKARFKRFVENDIVSVGFLNLPFIKQFSMVNSLYDDAKRVIESNEGKTYVIVPYMVYHSVRTARKIKSKFGDKVIICLIVQDIFFPKKNTLNYWVNRYTEHEAVKSDCFILFTKAMADYLHIDERKFIVMESVIDGTTYKTLGQEQSANKKKLSVVYTGALGVPNGVAKLIEMMRHIQRNDFNLIVTGRGSLTEKIKEAAKEDDRICFMGTVPKDDVFKYQSQADVLINPRSDSDDPIVTKYMFPSKLMEYMLTGNAVLTYKMSGIPEEYYNYVFVAEDDTPAGLANALNSVLDLSEEERKKRGMAARHFILENKILEVQSKRIVGFLNKYELYNN